MSERLSYLSQKLINAPLAITRGAADVLLAELSETLGLRSHSRSEGRKAASKVRASIEDDTGRSSSTKQDFGYSVLSGVAVIPVTGTLVQKLGVIRSYWGITGYDGIRYAFMHALADASVDAIVFDIDSPGGEVSGCFDLVDCIFDARGIKPIWALLNESAYSAAYAIASAADVITTPRTGGTGSVGIIMAHLDVSKGMETAGVTVKLITYGDRKADGSSSQPLSTEAEKAFQEDVNTMGDLFVKTVARNRGMSFDAVRKTQAGTFLGAKGVEVGFADKCLSPDAAFRALLKTLPARTAT